MSELRWGERTYLMGIINLTPDSFSGDGLAPAGRSQAEVLAAALGQARSFVEAGADILDVGAESSRPVQFYGEHPDLDPAEEVARVVPVVAALSRAHAGRALVSVDTVKGDVAREALEAGAAMVNDVWAGHRDPGTLAAAAAADAYLVLMHNQDRAEYPDGLMETVVRWLRSRVNAAVAAGVRRERMIVDPGIGFGKTPEQSVELVRRLAELKDALDGMPLLIGTSRKRFIGELLGGAEPDQRVEGTAATVALAIAAGADVVRVHDVEHMARVARVSDGIVRGPM